MTMERSFINQKLGFACCCWDAPSVTDLTDLFNSAGTVFSEMIPVEEYSAG